LDQCNGTDDALDGWRTPDASCIDMEGTNEKHVMIINLVQAAEEKPPRCLKDEEECSAWKEWKECEKRET
jgi:hypothetical protein